MARKIPLLRALLFSLGIMSALAFGAGTALDGNQARRTCGDPAAYGSCAHWYACEKICERYGFDPNPVVLHHPLLLLRVAVRGRDAASGPAGKLPRRARVRPPYDEIWPPGPGFPGAGPVCTEGGSA